MIIKSVPNLTYLEICEKKNKKLAASMYTVRGHVVFLFLLGCNQAGHACSLSLSLSSNVLAEDFRTLLPEVQALHIWINV